MKNKHFWIMLACCLVPLVGLGIAWYWGVPLGTLGIVILLLACPLGHLLLMRNMGHGKTETQVSEASRSATQDEAHKH